MNKYDVTLTAHYEKTVSVYADTPEQAKEKIETVLFDTDIIQFTDEDFIGGDAAILVADEKKTVKDELSTTTARTARTSAPYVGSVCVRTSAKIDMSYQALNLVIHPAMDTKFACQGDAPETPL